MDIYAPEELRSRLIFSGSGSWLFPSGSGSPALLFLAELGRKKVMWGKEEGASSVTGWLIWRDWTYCCLTGFAALCTHVWSRELFSTGGGMVNKYIYHTYKYMIKYMRIKYMRIFILKPFVSDYPFVRKGGVRARILRGAHRHRVGQGQGVHVLPRHLQGLLHVLLQPQGKAVLVSLKLIIRWIIWIFPPYFICVQIKRERKIGGNADFSTIKKDAYFPLQTYNTTK